MTKARERDSSEMIQKKLPSFPANLLLERKARPHWLIFRRKSHGRQTSLTKMISWLPFVLIVGNWVYVSNVVTVGLMGTNVLSISLYTFYKKFLMLWNLMTVILTLQQTLSLILTIMCWLLILKLRFPLNLERQ